MITVDFNYDDFRDPWALEFPERLRRVFDKPAGKRVIYLYNSPDYGTFRYRAYNMCQVWERLGYSASFFFEGEFPTLNEYISQADIVVVCRVPWSLAYDSLIQRAKGGGLLVCYDVDDLVFDLKQLPELLNTLGIPETEYNYWFEYVGKRFLAAQYADMFITTTKFLGNYVRNFFHKPTISIPNFMNSEQVEASSKLWDYKEEKQIKGRRVKGSKEFLLGYFSGTSSHNLDFGMIAENLNQLLSEQANLRLRIVGFLELPPILHAHEAAGRIERLPLQNFLNLQVKIAEVDLNLVPLIANNFTHGKSELKYFESAVVGTPSLASPTRTYAAAIKNGDNGFLCQQGQWYETLQRLITFKPTAMQQVVKRARQHALKNYTAPAIAPMLRALAEQRK